MNKQPRLPGGETTADPGDSDSDAGTPLEAEGLLLAPFQGVRYATDTDEDLGALTSPPYDLIDSGQARHLHAADPHNVVRLIRSRDGSQPDSYQQVGRLLERWLDDGVLRTEPEPAIYVYERRRGPDVEQRGLIGGLLLDSRRAGIVLPHEDTMPGPIADRLELMRATEANLEPIFLLYEGKPGGSSASAIADEIATTHQPCCFATDGDVHYRLWPMTDRDHHARVNADLQRRSALIADGHHRYATYLEYQAERHAEGHGRGPWDYGLALLVDSVAYPPRLGAVHRVIPSLDPEEAVRLASTAFRVSRLPGAPEALDALAAVEGPAVVTTDGTNYHLLDHPDPARLAASMPTHHSPTWQRLASSVLHQLLITKIWGVNENEPSAISFQHDVGDACRHARESGGTAALLPPMTVADVLTLARAGERVPRKSTSFGPKPRTGMVMRAW